MNIYSNKGAFITSLRAAPFKKTHCVTFSLYPYENDKRALKKSPKVLTTPTSQLSALKGTNPQV